MAPQELRLGLSGRALIFPDGRPFCLACGRKPFRSRPASFRDPDFAERESRGLNTLLEFVHPLLARANTARLVSFEFDAPLCLIHFWKGRLPEAAAIGLFALVAGALLVLGLAGALPRGERERGWILRAVLLGAVFLGAFLIWRRSRPRRLLPCDAWRESRDTVVLVYPDEAPHPQ